VSNTRLSVTCRGPTSSPALALMDSRRCADSLTALSEIPAALAQTAAWFESLAAAASPIDVRDGRQASVTLTVGR